jgi:endoglucanase
MTGSREGKKVGEIVGGKYRLVRYLASGGMGDVYEAQHTVVKRRFAIKLLHAELAAQRESLARFQREAQAAGALESENVAAAVDFGIAEDGSPYIVMEYLAGESLRTLVDRRQRMPVSRATDLVAQACRGVGAAHKAGIVHRDLNPQNLFVCRREDGTDVVKVLDFGVAKLEAIESAETRTGTILGTPAYLSPEQARGEKTVDHRTDIYGLGAVLYELLAGKKPHPGDSHNAILHHICTQPALPLEGSHLDLPPALVEVVHRALASDPRHRQDSAEALAQDLAPWARREIWPAPSVGPEDAGASVLESTFAQKDAGLPPGTVARRRWIRATLALAGLVGLVGSLLATGVLPIGHKPSDFHQRPFPVGTHLFVPPPNPGAVDQIAALATSNAGREAAAITAMEAVPQAIWFSKGTPEEVQSAVSNAMVRAAQDGSLRVLVASNRPYRDCAGFSAGGAKNTAAYEAWIDGFARGIGNERAVVIVEPDSTGMIPYTTSLDGTSDLCRPTVTDGSGRSVPAPGATADESYAQIRYAVASLAKQAPNAFVYLDGTHAGWLPAGEAAYRLFRSGVLATQGFAVNVSNFQSTAHSIRYGTWISECLHYATRVAKDRATPAAFRRCASQPMGDSVADEGAWASAEAWYAKNAVAHTSSADLVHFMIDTGRNGRGPLDAARYAEAPFSQSEPVIRGLGAGSWCNPPGTGLGLRPTTNTGVALLDAYLWIKTVGESDGSCDIAGGARAWNYDKYNPWGIAGDSQKHFDPLWGMVDPAAGTWFTGYALDLAQRAEPPLLP